MKRIVVYACLFVGLLASTEGFAQKLITVLPKEIDDVLINPGIGFTTSQQFNGDTLAFGLNDMFPIAYQAYNGTLENKSYPQSSIAYFRIYWRFLQPEKQQYNWDLIDRALYTAQQRNQKLMVRIAPYGHGEIYSNCDVPDWYRDMVGEKNEWRRTHKDEGNVGWMVDPEDPRYVYYFGRLISKFAERYDGHPVLESVDVSFVGMWGEHIGMEELSDEAMKALVNIYTDNFKRTQLVMQAKGEKMNKYALTQAKVGWRLDCLGDMGENWAHMTKQYPQDIVRYGLADSWERAPVCFESCWDMRKWYEEGWDIDYIINQSLKWHISSINNKSCPIPKEWESKIEYWLKKMGYRFVLRNFTYLSEVAQNQMLMFECWWENVGVAPCYEDFMLAFRIKSDTQEKEYITDANIKEWLPGDNLYKGGMYIPSDFPAGEYEIAVAIIDKINYKPVVQLAIEGKESDGWYKLGKTTIVTYE